MAGRKRPIHWSLTARADLSGIWIYYFQSSGRSAADAIVRNIESACRMLDDHPFAGRARDEVRPGLRSLVANPYVIFYRIGQDSVAEIVRVLDGRRDLEEIFADDTSADTDPETPRS